MLCFISRHFKKKLFNQLIKGENLKVFIFKSVEKFEARQEAGLKNAKYQKDNRLYIL